MHAHEHGLRAGDVALDQGEVGAGLGAALVGVDREVAEDGGQVGVGIAAHGDLAVLDAVADDVAHGGDLEAVLFGEDLELGHAGHGAVFVHDFADDAGGLEAGELGKIDAAFGLARALEHAAGAGAQRKDVAWGHEVFGTGAVGHGRTDGMGAVGCGDAGGHAVAGLDGDGEVGAELRVVVLDHEIEAELVAEGGRHGQAHEAAAVMGHEVDGFGGRKLGGHGEVALVLPVLVVDQDDHLAFLDFGDRFFNRAKSHIVFLVVV